MRFRDRNDAARQLATALQKWSGKRPLVLAIARGAVPMGKIIADALGGELDVVLVRKLRAPANSEFAVGAVAEAGYTEIAAYAAAVGANEDYLRNEIAEQQAVIRQRRASYAAAFPPIDPIGRVVIVVDDGLATGATMTGALRALLDRNPERLICAVPISAMDALVRVKNFADEVVCLYTTNDFVAVGQFYVDFSQVNDDEVFSILRTASVPLNQR